MNKKINTERDSCTICGGQGYLLHPHDSETRIKCRCTLRALYRSKLGDEIFDASELNKSEYSERVDTSLFVTSTRRDFLPHIRHALIDQGLHFFSRMTNDSQMLDAWLSKERSRSQYEGTEEMDFTSLRDLVEDPQLLVIFLGVVSYPNRALPGVLLEALRIRTFEGKPTWVINPHVQPFSRGHLCWAPETEEYIIENFDQYTIKPSIKTKRLDEGLVMQESEKVDAKGRRVKVVKPDLSNYFK